MEQVSLLVAFGAGLLSFLSPCVIPLAPVYLASLGGPEVLERGASKARLPVFLRSFSFVAGFTLVFVLMGALAGLAGLVISPFSLAARAISGGFMIAFGIFLIAAHTIPWLNYEKRVSYLSVAATGRLRPFLTGAVLCLGWIPCITPVLGGIMTLAFSSATAWTGAYLMAAYSLGLGLPFLALGIAFDFLAPLLRRVNRYSRWIYLASGILLIAVGILILANKLVWFQAISVKVSTGGFV